MMDKVKELYEYDETGDVLDVYFGEKRAAWTIELTDNITISIDRPARKAVSLSFMDFSELIRPTAWGPRSFPLTGLADLPAAEREMVIDILTSPPVNAWLDVSAVQALPDSPFAVTHLHLPPPKTPSRLAAAI
ncbi:MAG: DUF2283 domain-containing protein [Chloroflexi bacterium]|nr:DUF2283 domain-containing protein [Chloroflexota bacterium]